MPQLQHPDYRVNMPAKVMKGTFGFSTMKFEFCTSCTSHCRSRLSEHLRYRENTFYFVGRGSVDLSSQGKGSGKVPEADGKGISSEGW